MDSLTSSLAVNIRYICLITFFFCRGRTDQRIKKNNWVKYNEVSKSECAINVTNKREMVSLSIECGWVYRSLAWNESFTCFTLGLLCRIQMFPILFEFHCTFYLEHQKLSSSNWLGKYLPVYVIFVCLLRAVNIKDNVKLCPHRPQRVLQM